MIPAPALAHAAGPDAPDTTSPAAVPRRPGLRLAPGRSGDPAGAAFARQKRRAPPRRLFAALSFAGLVVVPAAIVAGYLFLAAADQYHSEVAFSVRSEGMATAAAGLLGAITQISSGTATEAQILRDYVRSPQMAAAVDRAIGLRAIYARAPGDPVFSLRPGAGIEDLTDRWNRMVSLRYDAQSGILHIRANAFAREDARRIAQAILDESGRLVNHLSDEARRDAVRFAEADLADAEAHLRGLRGDLAAYRRETGMIDPAQDVAGQSGLVSALDAQLAEALVDRDTLLSYADEGDQRALQSARRIDAIRKRIAAERGGIGGEPGTGAGTGVGTGAAAAAGVDGSGAAAEVIGRYESLLTDIEFAQAAYTQALTNLAVARADARRTARYIAAHIRPTLADASVYPRRAMLTGLTGAALLLFWGVVMIAWYNVRDTR